MVATCWHRAGHVRNLDIAIAFGLFIAFGELLRLSLPGGREGAPIAMAAAFAYAMALKIAQPRQIVRLLQRQFRR